MIDVIMNSPQPVALICIGPMPNVAAALEREPRIAQRARFVGMDGSVRVGYDGAKTPCAEWNVKANPAAARKGLSADWPVTITPRDTVPATIMENYRLWSKAGKTEAAAQQHSSTLYDPVAVYLAFSQQFCKMERLRLPVTDDGVTALDDHAIGR